MNKLTETEIENFIKNPLPPPHEFKDFEFNDLNIKDFKYNKFKKLHVDNRYAIIQHFVNHIFPDYFFDEKINRLYEVKTHCKSEKKIYDRCIENIFKEYVYNGDAHEFLKCIPYYNSLLKLPGII